MRPTLLGTLRGATILVALSILWALTATNTDAQPVGAVTASGACSVVVANSQYATIQVQGCGRSPRDAAAFKAIENRLNVLLKGNRIEGDRLQALVSGMNLWFPVLSTQIESVQAEVQRSIAEAVRHIADIVRASPDPADLSVAFLSAAEKRIAGAQLTQCSCENPVRDWDPLSTFKMRIRNSVCLSGFEHIEACVLESVAMCNVKGNGYPPFRRVCE